MTSRKHQIATSHFPGPSHGPQLTDWNKCIICQTVSDKNLQCPATSKRNDQGAGYITFSAFKNNITKK